MKFVTSRLHPDFVSIFLSINDVIKLHQVSGYRNYDGEVKNLLIKVRLGFWMGQVKIR